MALNKQVIALPFSGIQTKVDPKMAPLGTYAVIDNMVMHRFPELVKRDGLNPIGVTTVPPNITTSYSYINEVGVITNNSLYSYSPSLDQYQLKGLTASPIVYSEAIIANTYAQVNCDGATTANDIYGCAWEDSRGGIRCSIMDLNSGTFLVSDVPVSPLFNNSCVKPKVVGYKNFLYFLYILSSAHDLIIRPFDTINNVFLTPAVITNNVQTCDTYDVLTCFSNLLIAVVKTTAVPDAVEAYYWDVVYQQIGSTINGIPAPMSLNFTNSGVQPPAISLAVDPTGIYFTCTIYNDSNEVWTKAFYAFLEEIGPETQVIGATTDPGWCVASCLDSNYNLYIFFSSFDTLHNSSQALVSSITTAPNIEYAQDFYLQMGVTSKAFFYSGNAYVILGYNSELQNTYFGVRDDGACFARLLSTLGGGNPAKANCVANFQAVVYQENTFILPLLKTTQIVSAANSYFSSTSVFTETIFFTPNTIDNKVLGQNLNIAGGYLKLYDGSPTVFEQGFHLYPEKPVLTPSTTMDGSLTITGSYAYVICWEWWDNQGQIYRSEQSVPAEITLTGMDNTVTVTVRTLSITNKETRFGNTRTPVTMAVFRTLTIGTTYYKVNQLPSQYVYNDPTAQTITFVDTIADSALQSNSLLYTTGGIFDNICLPAVNLMTVGKNTVFAAGTDTQPNMVFYSKQKQPGVGVEFANEMTFTVDSLGGNITALAAMDDKLLIFKKSLVYYIAGTLPDSLGNGSPPIPLLIASDCGCNSPQSVVLTGQGVMFQSQKGIYIVDRQLNINYIGQAIESTTNQPGFRISSAVNLPDQNRVYFTDIDNQNLVYDTYFSLWFTQQLPFSPVSSTVLNDVWYPSSNSATYMSVPGLATDGNARPIVSKIQTNWISLAQIEGFGRIYNISILGDNAELTHRLIVNLYYDFETFPRETVSIIPDSFLGADYGDQTPYGGDPIGGIGVPYGMDGVYGAGSTYGGAPFGGTIIPFGGYFDGTYQFMIRPREQKCTAIMIEIFDQFPTGQPSESFKFSGLSIVAGIKSGWNRNISYNKRLT